MDRSGVKQPVDTETMQGDIKPLKKLNLHDDKKYLNNLLLLSIINT